MEHNKDQSGAVASEKPQFPWNPDPINHEWTQPEIAAIHAFGEGCFQAGVSSVQSRAAVRGEAVADERWCLACDKAGHHTDECWSTYATNTPQARELMRLCHASVTSKVSARAADAPSEPIELVLAFGKGLIEVGQGHHGNERKPAILFGRNGAGAVGIETEGDRVMLPGECIAALTFDNPESLDVVAEKFSELRARIWPKSRAADALDSQPTEPIPRFERDEPRAEGRLGVGVPTAKRQELYQAALNCSHVIEENKITLRRNPKLPGNALSQLADRLEFASSQPTDGGVRNGN